MVLISDSKFCCAMRRHFLLGIVGTLAEQAPTDLVDFVISWTPEMIIGIKFCPFCGRQIERGETRRYIAPEEQA